MQEDTRAKCSCCCFTRQTNVPSLDRNIERSLEIQNFKSLAMTIRSYYKLTIVTRMNEQAE